MSFDEFASLALAAVCIAAFLVCEHYLVGRRVPLQVNYALGLVTDMGGILFWAALRGVAVTPLLSVGMLVAACLAGAPDFLILCLEAHNERQEQEHQRREAEGRQEQERAAWRQLAQDHAELAGRLALMQVSGNAHRYSRAHDLLESVLFLRGGIRQDLADMRLVAGQLEAILAEVMPGQSVGEEGR